MSQNKLQKLELTWIGKGDEPKLEPRILIENPEYSYGDPRSENMLIHGDNLLALKALEQDYGGKVKCIYIDPPYNTGNAFEHYDDGVEHSLWLSLMKPRLEIIMKLLCNDGLLAVQIDDNEYARLYLLLTEVFQTTKNIKTIVVKMSEASGLKMGSVNKAGSIPKLKEYIILVKKDGLRNLYLPKIPKDKWDTEYNIFLENFTQDDRNIITEINEKEHITNEDIEILDKISEKITLSSVAIKIKELGIESKEKENWCFENSWRICQCATSSSVLKLVIDKKQYNNNSVFFVKSSSSHLAYMVRADFNADSKKPRVQLIFADDNLAVHPGDLWTDIKTTGLEAEGKVEFKNGKKPESLVRRIIAMNTGVGDYVLDSFLGSGTTAATAHKMKRKWIGIELGNQALTHCLPRLKRVVENDDPAGVTSIENWQGGGGFKFYTLAPSMLQKDKYGNWVIDGQYNPTMLAAAMAKQEGFKYQPHDSLYWKQGTSSGSDFIYTTTQFITVESLDQIHEEMQPGESVLICCKSFQKECKGKYNNVTIKKIPQMLLGRCEFGKEDYSLNIVNMPVDETVNDNDAEAEISIQEINEKPKKKNNSQPTLFD